MSDPIELLKRLRKIYPNQDELAAALGTTQSTVSRVLKLKSGGDLKLHLSRAISELAQENGLVGAAAESSAKPARASGLIPEIDVHAGLGGGGLATVHATTDNGITYSQEAVRDHWRLPDATLVGMGVKSGHIAAFRCQGDSMTPTILDGDVVFADTRHRIPSPPGVYVLTDQFGGVIIKRLEVVSRPKDEVIRVAVISDNPRHSTQELEIEELHILGRMIGRFTS